MMIRRSLLLTLPLVIALAACGADPRASSKGMSPDQLPLQPGESTEMRGLINKYADHYEVPRTLVHRIVQRESGYNPTARNGSYMGLMQIDPRTASTMGFAVRGSVPMATRTRPWAGMRAATITRRSAAAS